MTTAIHPRPALELSDVTRVFEVGRGRRRRIVRAVDAVSLSLHHGETLAIVGESGSGKTTLARLALRLLEPTSGEIIYRGSNVTGLSERALRGFRAGAQMVFQDPFDSLSPWHTVEQIVSAPLRLVPGLAADERRSKVRTTLERVGLGDGFLDRYRHELSGGQAQRVGIARAVVTDPGIVVLDEPTSALDMSVQAQILALLHELQQERGLSYLLISHDLSVVRSVADRAAVMSAGKVIEQAPCDELFASPTQEYTRRLIAASPRIRAAKTGPP